ncbi:MAG TPA: ABC transporter permease [Phycisphaerales bacterium]|nr:ABC transporter permease [Phycisphaerales bacterium]
MISLILRRLMQLPLILLVIYTLTLTLAWAIPGSPLDKPEGRQPPPEVREAMLRQYDLHSFPRFYFSYLSNALGVRYVSDSISGRAREREEKARAAGQAPPRRFVFDLGPSLQYEDWRVNDIVAASLPVSVSLGIVAVVLATLIGVGAGVVGAARPGSILDLATLSVALVGVSLPSFVVGTALLVVFPVWLGVGTVGGWGTVGKMVLPAITLALPLAAYIARLTRMGMVEHLRADFIRTARAKGASEASVLLRHALKPAFLPVLSFLGPACAMAMTGSFVVEKVFSVPGMGQHFVNAVLNKDLFLIIGVVLIYASMLVLLNLAVDVLYRWIDPRTE